MGRKAMHFDDVRKIAMAMPEVKESTIHGAPSLKVRGKLLACPAIHSSAEANTLVVRIGRDERSILLATEPDVYYVTDHYVKHSAVLVRLSRIHRDALKELLEAARVFVITKAKKGG